MNLPTDPSMNLPIAAVGALLLLAFLAHVFVGVREAVSVRPSRLLPRDGTADPRLETLERNWAQSLCAFQLVTVDLLALSGLAFLIAFAGEVPHRKTVAFVLAGFLALWGVAWLVQLVCLKSPRWNYLLLGHWAFWFVCSGLVVWGAQSL